MDSGYEFEGLKMFFCTVCNKRESFDAFQKALGYPPNEYMKSMCITCFRKKRDEPRTPRKASTLLLEWILANRDLEYYEKLDKKHLFPKDGSIAPLIVIPKGGGKCEACLKTYEEFIESHGSHDCEVARKTLQFYYTTKRDYLELMTASIP